MKRSGYCEFEDAPLYYETTEGPAERAVVLLHGGLGNIEEFAPLLELISGAFHVVAVDLRGHGRSTLGTKLGDPLAAIGRQYDLRTRSSQGRTTGEGVFQMSRHGLTSVHPGSVALDDCHLVADPVSERAAVNFLSAAA